MNIPIALLCSAMLACTAPMLSMTEASAPSTEIVEQSDDIEYMETI